MYLVGLYSKMSEQSTPCRSVFRNDRPSYYVRTYSSQNDDPPCQLVFQTSAKSAFVMQPVFQTVSAVCLVSSSVRTFYRVGLEF